MLRHCIGALSTAALTCALVASLLMGQLRASEEQGDFAVNVTRHVVLHEFAHALVRELGLPVLGNEEVMADAFATLFIVQRFRDSAGAIISDRARSWLLEAKELRPENFDLAGEHELDERRAYRAMCLLYGADPQVFAETIAWIGLSRHDAEECADIAPQITESWQAVLRPHRLPGSRRSGNVRVIYGDVTYSERVRASRVLEEVAEAMRGFDWPEPVVLHYDSCGRESASWSRRERKVLLCDEYFRRFVRQEAEARLR